DGFDGHIDPAPPAAEHLLHVRVTEVEPSGELVVLLVEGSARYKNPNVHGATCLPSSCIMSALITARGAPPPRALARRLRASLGPQALSKVPPVTRIRILII